MISQGVNSVVLSNNYLYYGYYQRYTVAFHLHKKLHQFRDPLLFVSSSHPFPDMIQDPGILHVALTSERHIYGPEFPELIYYGFT